MAIKEGKNVNINGGRELKREHWHVFGRDHYCQRRGNGKGNEQRQVSMALLTIEMTDLCELITITTQTIADLTTTIQSNAIE